MPNKDGGEYEIGRGQPSKHTQFKKGQSGNPKGRPRTKKTNRVDIAAVLTEPVKATFGERDQYVSPFEASFRRLAEEAIQGDLRAIIKFISVCEDYDVIAPPPNVALSHVIIVPKGVSMDEWLANNTKPASSNEE